MSLPDLNNLADAVRRDKLTAGQETQLQAYLASHPEERAFWEEELNLNHCLRQVPDVAVSSNFTAQVLERAAREVRKQGRDYGFWRRLTGRHWLPKLAGVTAILGLGLFGFHQHQLAARRDLARQEIAQTLAAMAATGNSVELLVNFDAIRRLAQVPHDVDRDLIAALQ